MSGRKPILIAADIPIGLPSQPSDVYKTVKAKTFLEWLGAVKGRLAADRQTWREGLIAAGVAQRSAVRPFVSIGKGEEIGVLRAKRACDKASNAESVYCLDHGGKQVGRAALQLWFEVLLPLRRQFQQRLAVWTFEPWDQAEVIVAVRAVRESGIEVRQSSGLRIGILVCDDQAWAFAPTALYVQPEIHSDETPNAVELRATDVDRIMWRLSPEARKLDEHRPLPADLCKEIREADTEIGQTELPLAALETTEAATELAPPIAFDVARQVRVFEPYIQYVEISLAGCAIQRHRVEVPKSIQRIDAEAEINARLRTTFELIEKNSAVSSKALEDELKQLRDNFTRALGKPWGRVLLRSTRPLFDERIGRFRERLAAHKKAVEESLAKHLKKSGDQLIEYFLPLVKRSPPDVLLGQITTREPNDDQIRSWLGCELDKVFPEPQDLVTEMKLDVQFRDVTYETLNEEGFGEKLRDAYPQVNWDKPFDEFDAAKARDSEGKEQP